MLKMQLVMSAIADLLVSQEMEMEPFGILTVKRIWTLPQNWNFNKDLTFWDGYFNGNNNNYITGMMPETVQWDGIFTPGEKQIVYVENYGG